MNLGLAIFLIIIALLIGLVGGFYGARAYMKKYFQDNPPISEDMIAAMMAQMGQKPSAKKLNQVMNMMKHQQQNEYFQQIGLVFQARKKEIYYWN